MSKLIEVNLNTDEQARRYVVGAAIIAAVLFNPAMPAWLALLGCYPIFTAILQYDPLNSLFHIAFEKLLKPHGVFMNKNLSA